MVVSNGNTIFLNDRFVNADGKAIGPTFTTFLFQLSFATTATTIVSGGIAERCEIHDFY